MAESASSVTILDAPDALPWDYSVRSIHARHTDVLEEQLKDSGRQGWELVFMTSPLPNEYICVFRRPGR